MKKKSLIQPPSVSLFLSCSLSLPLSLSLVTCMWCVMHKRCSLPVCCLSLQVTRQTGEELMECESRPRRMGNVTFSFFFVVQPADVRYVQPSCSVQTWWSRILSRWNLLIDIVTHIHRFSSLSLIWKSTWWIYVASRLFSSLKHMRNNNDTLNRIWTDQVIKI